jgi:uncharacterized damage-inducible protein DinB
MSPFLSSIQTIMIRDLNKLQQEIELYQGQDLVWTIQGEIKNSAGNLCLHLCGNLQHYIGGVLGKSGYVRNRDAEFSTKSLAANKLVDQIQAAKKAISDTLPHLNDSDLDKEYPERVFADPMTTRHFLIHLTAHLGYHLGQVNYHRRLVN